MSCKHDYDISEPIVSTGENLLGDKVACLYRKYKCKNCREEFIKLISFDPKYDIGSRNSTNYDKIE